MMVRIGTLVLGSDRKQLNSHHSITAHKKNNQKNVNMEKPSFSSMIRSITEIQSEVVLPEPEEDEDQHCFPKEQNLVRARTPMADISNLILPLKEDIPAFEILPSNWPKSGTFQNLLTS